MSPDLKYTKHATGHCNYFLSDNSSTVKRPYSESCFERGKPVDVKLSSPGTELYSNKHGDNNPQNIYDSKCPCIKTARECRGYVVSTSAYCGRQGAGQSHRPPIVFENLNDFHIPSRKISEYHISYDRLLLPP